MAPFLIKLAGPVIMAAVIGGAGWFIYDLIQDNAVLKQNELSWKEAMKAKEAKEKQLKEEIAQNQKLIKEREHKRYLAQRKANRLESELKQALSAEEKECYEAVAPDIVIDNLSDRLLPPS